MDKYFLTRGPEGLQDPEGLALGLAPAEDLVQGPTGPEGPTPGYKFYWPEVVVVGGEGIRLLMNPGTGTSRLMILEVPDASCWSKASSSSLISSIVSLAITLHDLVVGVLVLDIIRNRYTLLSEDPGSTETVGCTRGLGWG